MKLGFEEEQSPYDSGPQSARFWTEAWVHNQVYCPNCGQSKISKFENNRPVADFYCASCREEFELKSQKTKFGAKVVDGAFSTMRERLASSNSPNLMLMNYDRASLSVRNLLIVPKQFFVHETIEERKPLAQTARRAGWIGCNILLNRIPELGKVFFVRDGNALPKDEVLSRWQQTLFLRGEGVESRGWLIEVMKCVELIGKSEFDLDEVYAHEARLSHIYPDNHNVRPKIRQQLQVLRDSGYLEFVARGRYRRTLV
ncbi:MAG TPA: DpnI domain-containing protein [Rhizomicrobium sp.]|jgi:type II restriction enzyme|nr:DpnI domain-containing protein [Rhizomicrobium sp.]